MWFLCTAVRGQQIAKTRKKKGKKKNEKKEVNFGHCIDLVLPRLCSIHNGKSSMAETGCVALVSTPDCSQIQIL